MIDICSNLDEPRGHYAEWGKKKKQSPKVTNYMISFTQHSRNYTVHGILHARILDWLAFPFSRGSSQPRDRTQVPCIAGRFFTILYHLSHPGSPKR